MTFNQILPEAKKPKINRKMDTAYILSERIQILELQARTLKYLSLVKNSRKEREKMKRVTIAREITPIKKEQMEIVELKPTIFEIKN